MHLWLGINNFSSETTLGRWALEAAALQSPLSSGEVKWQPSLIETTRNEQLVPNNARRSITTAMHRGDCPDPVASLYTQKEEITSSVVKTFTSDIESTRIPLHAIPSHESGRRRQRLQAGDDIQRIDSLFLSNSKLTNKRRPSVVVPQLSAVSSSSGNAYLDPGRANVHR